METKQLQEINCKLIPYTTILKSRGNEKLYQEAIEASSKFNKRLVNERKMRIPFFDCQTSVAQANSMIWNTEQQRTIPNRAGYIYQYPVKQWTQNRRLGFENINSNLLPKLETYQHQIIETSSNHPPMFSKQISNDEYHELNDLEDNDDSEFDDLDDPKHKKNKRNNKRLNKKELIISLDDKPYSCDRCGAKYKTKQGLGYHIQKTHENQAPAAVLPTIMSKIPIAVNQPVQENLLNDKAVCPMCNSSENFPSISCSECKRPFHPVCLSFTDAMIQSVKTYKWQCIDCKQCTPCGTSENDDQLLFCDDCDRGFHMYCLNPPLDDAPEGDWHCDLCIKQMTNK